MATLRRFLVAGARLAAGVARGAAGQAIPVRVGGEASSLVGVPLQVPIEVDLSARPDVKLGSFSLVIRWNPAVLRFDRGENGTFGDVFANEDSLPLGVARLVGANPGGAGGKVVLGIAHFTPIADAVDTFRLQVTELYAAGSFADLFPSATWTDRAYCTARGRFGDVNRNQQTNGQDALLVLSHAVGIDISAQGLPLLGDADGDGVTGARDALVILSAAVGLDVSAFRVLRMAAGPCGDARRPTFLVAPAQVTMDLGQAARLIAVARDSLGNGLVATDVSWKSSDTLVAKVSSAGVVTALAAGSATIAATRLGASSATAAISVSDRRVHWVDAFAFAADSDQIGAPELPFRSIPQALSHAQAGDTIKVRTGRYEDGISITKPVVIMGDTGGGRPRPLIAATGSFTVGFSVNTGGRVELHDLRMDTLYQAVDVDFVDTLLVRSVQFRSPGAAYFGAVYIDSARALLVQRSGFFGARTSAYYYGNSAIWANNVDLVSVDSTVITDYGDDGIYLSAVDSLFVRHSVIRDNYGYGIYACTNCFTTGPGIAVVFTGNRMVQNQFGHAWVDQVRSARFDHNMMIGGGYDALNLYGDTASTLVTFMGDSITVRAGGGGWINLYNFDSLAVDSLIVQQRGFSYPYIRGGRITTVRNSRFLDLEGYALNVDAFPRDSSHLVLRKVEFLGPDSAVCDRCGYAVDSYRTSVDADSVVAANLNWVFDVQRRITLRHATVTHAWYLLYLACGTGKLSQVASTDVYYGVQVYGFSCLNDSLVVDSSSFRRQYQAINADYVTTLLTNTVFENTTFEAINQFCGPLRVVNVLSTRGTYGIDASGFGCTDDSLVVENSSFAQHTYGVYGFYMPVKVTNSTFTDNQYHLYLGSAPILVTNNTLVRPKFYGAYLSTGGLGSSLLLDNTVTCDVVGAAGAYGIEVSAFRPDMVAIANNTVTGCFSGVRAYGGSRTGIEGNGVSLPSGGGGYGIVGDPDTLLRVAGNTVSGPAKYGSIRIEAVQQARVDTNTVTGSIQAGIYVAGSVDSLTIKANLLSNHTAGTCCLFTTTGALVLDASAATNRSAEVLRNRITDTKSSGIVLLRDFGDTVTVQVDSNTVRRADSVGIWVRQYSKANIRRNAVDSVGLDAVQLNQFSGVAPALVHRNNFSRSRRYGVYNTLTSVVINADTNYWGGDQGPRGAFGNAAASATSADSVSQFVSWAQYLSAPEATLIPAPPPLVVALPQGVAARSLLTFAATGDRDFSVRPPPEALPPREQSLPVLRLLQALPHSPAPEGRTVPYHLLEADRLQAQRREARFAEKLRRLEERAALRAERERQRAELEAAREATRVERANGRPR